MYGNSQPTFESAPVDHSVDDAMKCIMFKLNIAEVCKYVSNTNI